MGGQAGYKIRGAAQVRTSVILSIPAFMSFSKALSPMWDVTHGGPTLSSETSLPFFSSDFSAGHGRGRPQVASTQSDALHEAPRRIIRQAVSVKGREGFAFAAGNAAVLPNLWTPR